MLRRNKPVIAFPPTDTPGGVGEQGMKFDEFNPAKGLENLAREFWGAWSDFARQGEGAQGAIPGWQQAIDWWTHAAHGGREDANAAVEQFNRQGAHWFGLMQSVASQFAGHEGSAAEVARAWQKAVGAQGENPFPEMFRSLRGRGVAGLEQWVEDASPYLDAWRKEASGLLSLPSFGLAREHQERWQAMQRAQLALRESQSAYQALLAKVGQRAFEIFEGKLAERSEPGRQIESARALFDLWIDAAEEGYAEIALSPEFRSVYGKLVNDMMRLRKSVQDEVERMGGLFGLPSRSEIDASHRKLHALEKEVRALRAQLSAMAAGEGGAKAKSAPRAEAVAKPARAEGALRTVKAGVAQPEARATSRSSKAAKPAASKAKAAAKPAKKSAGKAAKPPKPAKPAKPVVSLARMPVNPQAAGRATAKSDKSKPKSRSAKA
jgi:polyhydroxyalkanoate synthase subunit PhaE